MPDNFPTDDATSVRMKRISQANTAPERLVASFLHRKGLRFRKNQKSLPGSPDIALRKYKVAIFVHGCYWHNHSCRSGKLPKRNRDLWAEKMERNKQRDARKEQALIEHGWTVYVIWTCQLKNQKRREITLSELYESIVENKSS